VLDRCAALVRDTAMNKGLAFEIEESAELPASCDGDELRVTQVLMNLLTNAIKFTQQGSVTLSASRQNSDAAEVLTFRVADSGIGMNPEELAHLFLPFEQADSSTTRRFGGTGLGLAISKRLLDLMGGQISVSSQPGQGSVFEVNLPLLHAEGLAAARAPAVESAVLTQAGPSLQGLDILVAEDNEVNRMVLANLLAKEGCQLIQVENGRLAVELVQARGADAFDLVLMDIQMPVLDGLAACREIRTDARFRDLPILAMTAHAMSGDREASLDAGMNDHLTKPIDPATLFAALLHWIPAGHYSTNAPASEAPTQTADEEAQTLPELEGIDQIRGLAHHMRRPTFYRRILGQFNQEFGAAADDIDAAIRAQDFERARRLAHSVKSASATIGAEELSRRARILEHRLAAGKAADAELIPFRAALTQIVKTLSPLAQSARLSRTDNAHCELRIGAALEVLNRMELLLQQDDAAAETLLADLECSLIGPDWQGELDRLRNLIEEIEYSSALNLLASLRSALKGTQV